MREKIVAGNWKMNPNAKDADRLWSAINEQNYGNVNVMVFPPSIYLRSWEAQQNKVALGAQDVYHEKNGAFTGEISAEMLASMGVNYSLVGHSERRTILNESDLEIRKKIDALLQNKLKVILCCGEPLAVRQDQKHKSFVEGQIESALSHLGEKEIKSITIAYEPIWAIGTGETAKPEQAQEMHSTIRKKINQLFGVESENISIIYGGSCKPNNAADLFAQPDIDGGLIGGASLNENDFYKITDSFS